MSNPEAPRDDTTQLEQTVQTEPTEQLDLPDATRAMDVEEPQQPAEPLTAENLTAEAGTDGSATYGSGTDGSATDGSVADEAAWPPATPERPTGPHAPAIVLGLVCLAVAVIVLAQELGSLTVDWGDVGPFGIVAAGALLVLFGLVGLLTSRRKAND